MNRIDKHFMIESTMFAIFILICLILSLSMTNNTNAHPHTEEVVVEMTDQEKARFNRKLACHLAYQKYKDAIEDHKRPVERCATFATLTYAWEGNYGQSAYCHTHKNCYGLMEWTTGKRRIWRFDSYQKADQAYADLYFRVYHGLNLKTHINLYSGNDRVVPYKNFIAERWDETISYFSKS